MLTGDETDEAQTSQEVPPNSDGIQEDARSNPPTVRVREYTPGGEDISHDIVALEPNISTLTM